MIIHKTGHATFNGVMRQSPNAIGGNIMMQSRKQLNVMLEPINSSATSTPKISDTPTTMTSLP